MSVTTEIMIVRAARRAAAEEMRERAAREVDPYSKMLADVIRAIPIEE